jgi:aldose 1-epimerase
MTNFLTVASDELRVQISPRGARLCGVYLRHSANLVLDANEAKHPSWLTCYPGVLVGPVANRVRHGRFMIDGCEYQMPQNESGATCLHSGPHGLQTQHWQVIKQNNDRLILRCLLADGVCGLPGHRDITAEYAVAGATLTLTIIATTTKPTPMNIAHHPYWRLGDAGLHYLHVNADHYLPVNKSNIPTGEVRSVDGTRFDFRTPRQVPHNIDHNLCLSHNRHATPYPAATLTGADGLQMKIETTEPGLQVYGGAQLPVLLDANVGPNAGIALEPQGWPNAMNEINFPSVLLRPASMYRQITRYCFETIK